MKINDNTRKKISQIFKFRYLFIAYSIIGMLACFGKSTNPPTENTENICKKNNESIFENLYFEKSKETIQVTAGEVTSIVAASGMALTETIVYLGGGAVVGILVCSPALAIEIASKSKSKHGINCAFKVGSRITMMLAVEGGYEYTKKVWKETKNLRNFEFDEISSLVRENCKCYINSGDKKDLETALKQISQLKKKEGIWPHLSISEKESVEALEEEILTLLNNTNL